MATLVVMPRLGYSMDKGMIEKWHKNEGDPVEKEELLLSILTDKVSFEYQSPATGILRKILRQVNETVPVSEPIGIIAGLEEDISNLLSAKPEMPEKEPAVAARPQMEKIPEEPRRGFASPLVKKIAQEHNIDLSKVIGTGPGGKIMKEDVFKVVEKKGAPVAAAKTPPAEGIPVAGIRKIIGQRMSESKRNFPHFYLSLEVDMAQVLEIRNQIIERIEKERGIRVSVTDLLVKIVAQALKKHPMVNSTFEEERIRLFPEINVAVAMAGKEGLIVPVVHQADQRSIGEISSRLKELNQKVQDGNLSLEDVQGGTFTLSNLGMFGIDQFIAIINPPQCAILAVGKVNKKAVVINDQVVIRPMAWTTLSADHRIVDGKQGAEFLAEIKEIIENPNLLLV